MKEWESKLVGFGWSGPKLERTIPLAFISGTMEAVRRHSTSQAQAVFALYADGALETEDADAIDDARRKDDEFDGGVKAYLQISEEVRTFAAGATGRSGTLWPRCGWSRGPVEIRGDSSLASEDLFALSMQ